MEYGAAQKGAFRTSGKLYIILGGIMIAGMLNLMDRINFYSPMLGYTGFLNPRPYHRLFSRIIVPVNAYICA